MDETFYLPGVRFRVPRDGGALLEHFAGRQAQIEEIAESRSGQVVLFTVAGVRIGCPLAYLKQVLRTSRKAQ